MDTFEIKLSQFSGPMDKLLELIEERKMEITTLNLATVTADFLEYVKKLGEKSEPAILADFLVVAAKLVLIKSKTLLPNLELTADEESEILDLETRLKIYKEFAARIDTSQKSAAHYLNQLWERKMIAHSRPLLMSMAEIAVFYPAPNLNLANLQSAISNLTQTFQELIPEQGKIKTFIISLEEKMKELISRCQEAIAHSFRNLTGNTSRSEIVVMFLAILHLLREKSIDVEQSDQFGDIIIRKNSK